jgi:hypothetical protein
MFAPDAPSAFTRALGFAEPQGSVAQIRNLRRLEKLHPQSLGVKSALEDIKKGRAKGRAIGGGGLLGFGITAGVVAASGVMTEGSMQEKARAMTSAVGMEVGFAAGSKVGLGIGAAIGGPVGGVVGFLAGGMIGGIAGGELTDAITRIPDKMVDAQRQSRGLDWGQHTAAFQTQRAHTMRQRSLAAMNRGEMSARSLLGQEALFVHR